MTKLVKNLFSLILPITVLVVIPAMIEKEWKLVMSFHLLAGLILILAGLVIMSITIYSFARIGKGTLAPWSPPRKLVLQGLYRHVRNPMILGVFTVLLGEALSLWSTSILIWAGFLILINTVYFIIYEEPDLEKRFGNDYREYKKHVPRWLPRVAPFNPSQQNK
jgi:protein-S-isoprenylcysteine O-methyltransferase Ste14